jgi:hypothetical protein
LQLTRPCGGFLAFRSDSRSFSKTNPHRLAFHPLSCSPDRCGNRQQNGGMSPTTFYAILSGTRAGSHEGGVSVL